MVLLARNPILMKYRNRDKTETKKIKQQIQKEEEEQLRKGNFDSLVADTPHDNANYCSRKDKGGKNFYRKKGPSRMVDEDDTNIDIALKKKLPRKKQRKKSLVVKIDKKKEKKSKKKSEKKNRGDQKKSKKDEKKSVSKEKSKKKDKEKSKTRDKRKKKSKKGIENKIKSLIIFKKIPLNQMKILTNMTLRFSKFI